MSYCEKCGDYCLNDRTHNCFMFHYIIDDEIADDNTDDEYATIYAFDSEDAAERVAKNHFIDGPVDTGDCLKVKIKSGKNIEIFNVYAEIEVNYTAHLEE